MMETKRYFDDIFDDKMNRDQHDDHIVVDESYALIPTTFKAYRKTVTVPHVSLTLFEHQGGLLYPMRSTDRTIALIALIDAQAPVCLGDLKLKPGDITVLSDQSKPLFFTPKPYRMLTVTMERTKFRALSKQLLQHTGKVIDTAIPNVVKYLFKPFEPIVNQPSTDDLSHFDKIQHHLNEIISEILEHNLAYIPKLTKGEQFALEIRNRVFAHIEPDIAIKNFAKEYGVTEQTMQNAFKSLFGMTPYKFLRNLKLNHVRKELLQADPKKTTVVSVANKWGFTHMGHFSGYYTQLFGENPSVTLQRAINASDD